MKKRCKHCGTRYLPSKGREDFCCGGCERVYGLIHNGGLGDFYALQDQVGKPIEKGEASYGAGVIQQILGNAVEVDGLLKVTAGVQGLSCMGCVWLVEQLARRADGIVLAKVALSSNRLSLSWRKGAFDLAQFALDLKAFGYVMVPVPETGFSFSPLTSRLGLTMIFSLNGFFLLVMSTAGIGSDTLSVFYELLVSACLVFSLLIGGSLFALPAWRGVQLGKLHSDLIPATLVFFLFALTVGLMVFELDWKSAALCFLLLLPILVFSRWLSEVRVLRTCAN